MFSHSAYSVFTCSFPSQVLFLGVLFVTVRTTSLPCHEEGHLKEKALKRHKIQPSEHTERVQEETPVKCPVELYASLGKPLKDRSISPWRIVYETEEGRFPETIAVAQCLCEGCILMNIEDQKPWEDYTYGSVTVKQSKRFLRKELCEDGERYRLKPYDKDVAVGCTCSTHRI
uniref:Uncharacterized protein n=1 Tax=Gadus morhua TaxID=8049 RepID=A0A8C5A365_GADMO